MATVEVPRGGSSSDREGGQVKRATTAEAWRRSRCSGRLGAAWGREVAVQL